MNLPAHAYLSRGLSRETRHCCLSLSLHPSQRRKSLEASTVLVEETCSSIHTPMGDACLLSHLTFAWSTRMYFLSLKYLQSFLHWKSHLLCYVSAGVSSEPSRPVFLLSEASFSSFLHEALQSSPTRA